MLKTVLWIAAACAAVLVALAVSRTLHFDSTPAPKGEVSVAVARPAPAPPAVHAPPAPTAPPAAKPPPTPSELQVQEDAAATGMTTEPDAPKESPPT
ncbi:MAG: hypothetical protein JF588_00030 [Caulobacterales bacterium]|nr:hypothetical protein [Caulobacterales bacterium]